jgi:D-alanyl-D-alanine carboxypeptidase/D-alanyl-D-alanine-endopeptidase (penicillin-binding protein 4)
VHGSVPLPVQEIDGEPVGERPYTRPVAVANPTLFFTQAVRDGLIARGIAVAGEAVDRDDLSDVENDRLGGARRVLTRSESPPLSEIIAVVNKDSQNQYAETLLKALDVARGGSGTSTGGRAAIADVLRDWRLDPGALLMADGSGMSRYNYLSADLLAGILARLHADPGTRERFAATLPVAGRDGTLAERLRGTRAEGNAAAKTGSLANVRALSGYLQTRDGETLIFVIVANNFSIPGPTVTWIVDLAVEVLANFTRGHPGRSGSPGTN